MLPKTAGRTVAVSRPTMAALNVSALNVTRLSNVRAGVWARIVSCHVVTRLMTQLVVDSRVLTVRLWIVVTVVMDCGSLLCTVLELRMLDSMLVVAAYSSWVNVVSISSVSNGGNSSNGDEN